MPKNLSIGRIANRWLMSILGQKWFVGYYRFQICILTTLVYVPQSTWARLMFEEKSLLQIEAWQYFRWPFILNLWEIYFFSLPGIPVAVKWAKVLYGSSSPSIFPCIRPESRPTGSIPRRLKWWPRLELISPATNRPMSMICSISPSTVWWRLRSRGRSVSDVSRAGAGSAPCFWRSTALVKGCEERAGGFGVLSAGSRWDPSLCRYIARGA